MNELEIAIPNQQAPVFPGLLEVMRVGGKLTKRAGTAYCFAMKLRVHIEQDEDGMYVVECPTLPGCISQGKTREEALANIKDAIKGYIASLEQHNEPVPLPITEEIVEVST